MGFRDTLSKVQDSAKDAAKQLQAERQDRSWEKADKLRAQGIIMELNSLEGKVRLYEDRVEIQNLLGSKHRTIPYSQIHAVNLDKTSSLAKGTAAALTVGMSMAFTNKKRLLINAGTETVGLEFRTESLARIRQAIDIMNERIHGGYDYHREGVTVNLQGPTGAAASASDSTSSASDELRKLASLRDDGIISENEFEQKKKQILGL